MSNDGHRILTFITKRRRTVFHAGFVFSDSGDHRPLGQMSLRIACDSFRCQFLVLLTLTNGKGKLHEYMYYYRL